MLIEASNPAADTLQCIVGEQLDYPGNQEQNCSIVSGVLKSMLGHLSIPTSLTEQIAFNEVPSEKSTQFCPSEHGGIEI